MLGSIGALISGAQFCALELDRFNQATIGNIVMARILTAYYGLYSYGLYSYGLRFNEATPAI